MTRTLVGIAAISAALTAAPLRVTDVRQWELETATRVAIQVSGEFEYHAERLHNPERLFFDVQGARPYFSGKRLYSAEVQGKLLRKIRVAETQPGVTRVVLDLAGPVEYTATMLSNPDRLIVEMRAAAEAVPAPITALPARTPIPTEEYHAPTPVLTPPPPIETGLAARHTSDGRSSLIRALGLKLTRVVIDAGHGGHDQGTVGPHGLTEKDLVLDVARRVGKLVEERMGAEVVYTRSDDTFVPLERRTAIANEKKADLFLSIHANSSKYPRIGGVESYYLNFTDSPEALDVAARENASSQKSIYELKDIIQKITLHDKAEESKEFANKIQTALFRFAARYNGSLKNRGVKKAPFVVLVGATMPSVLAEIGFLSNPREEALLNKPEHRQKLAEALYSGISKYAEGLSHFQIAKAE